MSACASECDCGAPGFMPHEPDCHWWDKCDEGRYCDRHFAEAKAEHAWMRGMSKGACTGVLSDQDKQDLRDAGGGNSVRE